jgi:hypothetical protein
MVFAKTTNPGDKGIELMLSQYATGKGAQPRVHSAAEGSVVGYGSGWSMNG